MSVIVPKIIDMGAGQLVEVSYLEDVMHISRKAAFAYLKAMRIKPIFVGPDAYFSLPTFQRILHVLTRPGGPGFAFPGSTPRANDHRLREITDELLEEAMQPVTALEMEVARNPDGLTIQRLLKWKASAENRNQKEESSG